MRSFPCPNIDGEVELSNERERHITDRHPELLPEYCSQLALTLASPEVVRSSQRYSNAILLSRFFPDVRGGKHIVVVVITEPDKQRHWIVTAYITRKLIENS